MKLVIFDCDGTLVDSQHLIVSAMTAAYQAHAMPAPAREAMLSVVGLSLAECFMVLGRGVDGYPVASLAEGYKNAFHALREGGAAIEPLYPGAAEVVDALARRGDVALGIATGKSQRGVRMVLGHHGLIERFVTVQTADNAPSKPDPGMVLAAMREAGVGPQDTVVVGDTVYDVKMARAAGAAAIGVNWGYHATDALHEAGAHAVIDAFPALLPTLDSIWAG